MVKGQRAKSNKKTLFWVILLFFVVLILIFKGANYYSNPHNKYRAEGASSSAHMIIIDDQYWVTTTSGSKSKLVYTENPQYKSSYDKVYSHSVDKLNWTDDYILVGAQSDSTGKFSYMILDRKTRETEGFANEEKFTRSKREKGIEVEVLEKKYFDWHL